MKIINYSYKFRIYPTNEQCILINKHFGACRFVRNYFLVRKDKIYKETGRRPTYNEDSAFLTLLKKQHLWMYEVSSEALQQELRILDVSIGRFFNGISGYPKFHKKKRTRQSFRIPQHVVVEDKLLKIPKFREGIKIKLHRNIEGKIKNATLVKDKTGDYYVSICVEKFVNDLPENSKEIGIDVGVSTLITCSDGKKYQNIKPYRTLENRVKYLSKNFSKKQKGSNGKEKARKKLAKICNKIVNIRNNYLHQITHKIISENQTIFIENLNVSWMLKNKSLSKSIQDASFSKLLKQLEYKGNWYGRKIVKVHRLFPSSKTCSNCNVINKNLKLSDRIWTCSNCKVEHQRDLNAAINIYNEGKRTVGITGIASRENVRL